MAAASKAMSRAVVFCCLLGRPEAFLKVVFFMPSSRETRVIDLAKFSSL